MVTTRNTTQRREVIATLGRVQGFLSAQELHALIVRDGGRISLATVYAQLKRLADAHEVDVIMTDRGESLFRRCGVDAHHHHLACRQCGAIVEVDTPELEQWSNEIAARFKYSDVRHVLELSGVCPSCRST
ncbi:MAG TPA: transcriptional repressor [Acidimicrobiales bacterium]|nr:transcriptional repressor [Acidimicrobiales bacterium]